MIIFSLSALVLVVLALGMILPPLLHPKPLQREDRQHNIGVARRRLAELDESVGADDDDQTLAQARTEIEWSLLDDLGMDDLGTGDLDDDAVNGAQAEPPPKTTSKGWTALLLALIPALSVGLYILLGNPAALYNPIPTTQNLAAPSMAAPSMAELVRQLEQKLAANPGDAEGWALAARIYTSVGEYQKAARAYRILHQLVGDDPDVLVAWANALVAANDGVFTPLARTHIQRALEMVPKHQVALWLAAHAAESQHAYPVALAYLQRLLPLIQDDPPGIARVEKFIARLRQTESAVEQ